MHIGIHTNSEEGPRIRGGGVDKSQIMTVGSSMRRIWTVAAVAACTQLSGCWFIFFPTGLLAKAGDSLNGVEGDHCVSEGARVGDKITMPYGGTGEIKSLSGKSYKCSDATRPIRAKIE